MTLGFLPYVLASESDQAPIDNRNGDVTHCWIAPACAPVSGDVAEAQPGAPEESHPGAQEARTFSPDRVGRSVAETFSPGAGRCFQLSRCRVRIFVNVNLGRSHDWAVVISELFENPGALARPHLDQLATEIKLLHLPRVDAEQIAWFYQAGFSDCNHPPIDRVHFSRWEVRGKDVYFGFYLQLAPEDELVLAAGGMVEL